MNKDDFMAATFGEMNAEGNDYEDAVRKFADFLYRNYTSFIAAGFNDQHAFFFCTQILNNTLKK